LIIINLENTTMTKALEKKLIKKAQSIEGIEKAVIIDASTIVTAAWVRQKCKFGCSGYGASLTCPPNSPAPDQTAELLKSYKKGLLLHSHNSRNLKHAALEMEREAFLAGFHAAFGFGAGPWRLCKECALEDGCRHSEEARPSLEACGIDVFTTVRNNGFTINVLTSTGQTPDYFAAVMLE
jgi:predicted metal-binding protein